jgi:RNA-binding protein YhbY
MRHGNHVRQFETTTQKGQAHLMNGLVSTGRAGLRSDVMEELQKLLQGNFCVIVLQVAGTAAQQSAVPLQRYAR